MKKNKVIFTFLTLYSKTQNPKNRETEIGNKLCFSVKLWICKRTISIALCSSSMHVKPLKLNTSRTLSMLMFVSNFPNFILFIFMFLDFFSHFLWNYESFKIFYLMNRFMIGWLSLFRLVFRSIYFCCCWFLCWKSWIICWNFLVHIYGWVVMMQILCVIFGTYGVVVLEILCIIWFLEIFLVHRVELLCWKLCEIFGS